MSLTKIFRGKGGVGRSPLCKALAQMSMVSLSRTFVKRPVTSKEHKKTETIWRVKLQSLSTKAKESLTH